ncbi:hypothetical protein EVAR_6244_1 [Eumeta japonica]|uniref:Uncharacterized protein n=1 Tax=Eumeta variegata TaxID=151549 RepID=A0A4C1T964_EUMVA|nr:hypothetical protein EVAR_6244_1 [Eumeta japonica]
MISLTRAQFTEAYQALLATLNNSNNDSRWESLYLLFHIAATKLPNKFMTRFEQRHGNDRRVLPTFDRVVEFIEEECYRHACPSEHHLTTNSIPTTEPSDTRRFELGTLEERQQVQNVAAEPLNTEESVPRTFHANKAHLQETADSHIHQGARSVKTTNTTSLDRPLSCNGQRATKTLLRQPQITTDRHACQMSQTNHL